MKNNRNCKIFILVGLIALFFLYFLNRRIQNKEMKNEKKIHFSCLVQQQLIRAKRMKHYLGNVAQLFSLFSCKRKKTLKTCFKAESTTSRPVGIGRKRATIKKAFCKFFFLVVFYFFSSVFCFLFRRLFCWLSQFFIFTSFSIKFLFFHIFFCFFGDVWTFYKVFFWWKSIFLVGSQKGEAWVG